MKESEEFQTFEEHAMIYKALSHPTRLFIVHEISQNKLSVSELAKKVEVDISTISRHLDVLKKARIIEGVKDANQVFYYLKFKCVLKFFNCITNNIEEGRSK